MTSDLLLHLAELAGGAVVGGGGIAAGMLRWHRSVLAKSFEAGQQAEAKATRDRSIAEALDELRAQMAAVIQRLVSQDRFLEWVGSVVRKPGSDPPPRLTTLDDPWPDIEAEVRKLGDPPHGGLRLTDYYKGDSK